MRIRLFSLLLVLATLRSAAALAADVAAAQQPVAAASPAAVTKPAPAASPAAKSAAPHSKEAPADDYFGSFGMSPLSIRSTIGFLGRQYRYRTISDHDLLRKALLVEGAMRVWRTRYPQDMWLPPTFFHLEQLYQAVQTDEARKHATAILKDVVRYFPDTKEGHLSRSRLAAGFPPLVPESPLLVSPAPSAEPGASSAPAAGETGSPAPEAPRSAPPGASPPPDAGAAASPQPGRSSSPAPTATASPT